MNKVKETNIIDDIMNYKPNLFERILWPIRRFFKDTIPDIPYKIKHFCQRGRRGWSDNDWWNMDSYLVEIILPMLKKFKENNHGYPGDLTEEKWDELLGEMIIGFEAAKRVIDDDYYLETGFPEKRFEGDVKQWGEASLKDQKIFKQKMKVFIKYFFNLWD